MVSEKKKDWNKDYSADDGLIPWNQDRTTALKSYNFIRTKNLSVDVFYQNVQTGEMWIAHFSTLES